MDDYSRGIEYLPIMISAFLLLWKWTATVRTYFFSKKPYYNMAIVLLIGLSTLYFYYIGKYGIAFCGFWAAFTFAGLVNGNMFYDKSDSKSILGRLTLADRAGYILGLIVGIFILFFPYLKINDFSFYAWIGGERVFKFDMISEILFALLGLSLIFLNKMTVREVHDALKSN